jgi:DNA/RNA endonuclease G (NUC1)
MAVHLYETTIAPVERPVSIGNIIVPEMAEIDRVVRAAEARSTFQVDGSGITVAVLDTGLRTTHVDFAGRVPAQRNFTTEGTVHDARDLNGHGTNVTGLICGAGAATGLTPGVAPAARVIPLKVLPGTFEGVQRALEWVFANREAFGITAISMSLGSQSNRDSDAGLDDDTLGAAIRLLIANGIPCVVAAGNHYFTFGSRQGMAYPAIFRETISVGAVYDAPGGPFSYSSGAIVNRRNVDRLTPFSQRLHSKIGGPAATDIFAPGAIAVAAGHMSDDDRSEQHGTSQATPVTTGVILLMQAYYRRATGQLPVVADLVRWLAAGSVEIVDGDDEDDNVGHTGLTFRRIDAVQSLRALRQDLLVEIASAARRGAVVVERSDLRAALDRPRGPALEIPQPMGRPAPESERVYAVSEAPSPVVAAAEIERVSFTERSRSGYDPAFIGTGQEVPLPTASGEVEEDLAVTEDGERELRYAHFSILMSRSRRLARVTAVNIDGGAPQKVKKGATWIFDPRLDDRLQAGGDAYAHPLIDRGHLVRRLDPCWGDEAEIAEDDTFHFTNAAPQVHRFNDETFGDLEDHVLARTQQNGLRVSVFTGPIFSTSDRRHRGIQLPEKFFKIVAYKNDAGHLAAVGFRQSQKVQLDELGELERASPLSAAPFSGFEVDQVTIAEIEVATGLDFGPLRDVDPLAATPAVAETVQRRRVGQPEDIVLDAPARPLSVPSRRRRSRRNSRLALHLLGGRQSVTLESTGTGAAGPDLSDARIRTSLEAATARFAHIAERAGYRRDAVAADQAKVMSDADLALRKLASEGEVAEISADELVSLEAIIVPDGTRPALFVQDDDVNPATPDAGTWEPAITELRVGIREVAPSVGRINSPIGFPNYAGTGFLVAPGLIMTNRHVLEAIARLASDGRWTFINEETTIDFAAEFERERRREFRVTGVVFAGPEPIELQVDTTKLDMALLSVEEANASGDPLPPALSLGRSVRHLRHESEVYVLGYPGRPRAGSESGQVLLRVFHDEYFVKRFAPGFVLQDPDTIGDAGRSRVFTHDASTLGGNSGSGIIEFRLEGRAIVGLHFGGQKREENYAHAVARLEQILSEHGVTFVD